MSDEKIDYEKLVEKSLLSVVKTVLSDTEENGLKGNHYFYLTFKTQAKGVVLSERLKQAYPDEMTIVLQYEFYDLTVDDAAFSVRLSFGNVPETITVPFAALTNFSDPHAPFAMQFTVDDDMLSPETERDDDETAAEPEVAAAGNVVSLSAFRKNK